MPAINLFHAASDMLFFPFRVTGTANIFQTWLRVVFFQHFQQENKWPLSGKQHALLCLSQCFNLSQYPFPIVDVPPLLIVAEFSSPSGMGFHTLSQKPGDATTIKTIKN